MSTAKFVKKVPFVMFPLNKSVSDYSYASGNPTINIQFSQNLTRVISAPSVKICGRMYITGKTSLQMPANHFNMAGSQKASNETYEQVCDIDDRTGPSSMLQYVQCGDLYGSSYEIIDDYAIGTSSINSVTNGYYDVCSNASMSLSAFPNNDVVSREVSGPIEFAIAPQLGYIQSNAMIPLTRGFFLKFNLCAMALYGLDASRFTVRLENVYLMGDYFELDKPLDNIDMTYISRKHRNGTLNSGNEYLNVDLNLAQVQSINHNFAPKTWKESYSYISFSTCPLLEKDITAGAGGFKGAKIKQYNVNRGAIRFPNSCIVD
jgi:hypothetical protein